MGKGSHTLPLPAAALAFRLLLCACKQVQLAAAEAGGPPATSSQDAQHGEGERARPALQHASRLYTPQGLAA